MIASVAALIGDPARANMLTALTDGRALSASELANVAGVTIQTASGHLSKLSSGNLVEALKQGRHRYFRLADSDVASVLEGLMGLAERTGAIRVRTGPRDTALRSARVCYDHLAGERGVVMLEGLKRQGLIAGESDLTVTTKGRRFFTDFDIDVESLERNRRPVCRACLDWSERRFHLGGALGAAILQRLIDQKWVTRDQSRVLVFNPAGLKKFNAALI